MYARNTQLARSNLTMNSMNLTQRSKFEKGLLVAWTCELSTVVCCLFGGICGRFKDTSSVDVPVTASSGCDSRFHVQIRTCRLQLTIALV